MAKAGSMTESLRRGGDGLVSNQHGVQGAAQVAAPGRATSHS